MNWRDKQVQLSRQPRDNGNRLDDMNRAIAYLEEHLCEPDIEYAARIANCSSYHFQRIFSYLAGTSLFEYLRHRRLTLAAFALQEGRPVLEVALDYGYESPEAFARAFRRMHGMAPSEARMQGAALRACPRISFQITRQGEMELEYRIESHDAFVLFGIHTWISTENGAQNTTIPAFWQQCREDGTMERIREAAGTPGNRPLHAATYHCTDTGYDYLIGTYWNQESPLEGFTLLEVPAVTWSIFPTSALSMEDAAREITVLWNRIFTEWFPTSGYELAPAPELELHHRRSENQFQNEIWIPVQRS